MRERLKQATNEAHERMHAHTGFAAAAAGTISRAAYRDLLARLYGFHAAFDQEMATASQKFADAIELPARARAALLMDDLLALGASREQIESLPCCDALKGLRSDADRLGALYVVEGSTLGGKFIAKALATTAPEARRFFAGHGTDHGRLWRRLVEALDRLDGDPPQAEDAERAALAVFTAFERWMADWPGAYARIEDRAVA